MKAGEFVIAFGNLGVERCVINGADVTDLVEAASVVGRHGMGRVVHLVLKAGVGPEEIKGDGVVEVEPSGPDLARWLAGIDSGLLDEAVLKRMKRGGMGTGGSPIEVTLEVLREWARGADQG